MNRRNMKTRKLFNKMIMVHITINSLRNKFDMLSNSVTEYKDMPMISETKLDDTPKRIFKPYRWDKNSHGGGFLGYIRNNISSTLVKLDQKS